MIYLASPFTHRDADLRERRFQEACRAAAALMRAGLTVFSPIAHSVPIARFGLPTSWEFWSQVDRNYLSRCDLLAVLTLPGWRDSVGVTAEIEFAREFGLPVAYVSLDDLDAENGPTPSLAESLQTYRATEVEAA